MLQEQLKAKEQQLKYLENQTKDHAASLAKLGSSINQHRNKLIGFETVINNYEVSETESLRVAFQELRVDLDISESAIEEFEQDVKDLGVATSMLGNNYNLLATEYNSMMKDIDKAQTNKLEVENEISNLSREIEASSIKE